VIVVADASPLHYLILIDYVDVLQPLYGRVVVPPAVIEELTRQETPDRVKSWISNAPAWLNVQAPTQMPAHVRTVLGAGERDAIALATEMGADALLVDDRDARRECERLGIPVLGTLRVLADAAQQGFADLVTAFERLRATNFRASDQLLERIIERAGRGPAE
jgi:uncharacterized protein